MSTIKAGRTVRNTTFSLLRRLGMTTIFGNPGSTELPMLKHFPKDFHYVLGLQEASVVAMADGFAQATHTPAVVSLHSCVGTGNAMGNIASAYLNKTPLVIIAGQQTREMLVGEPMLTNHDPVQLPKPYVKWAYEPSRAQDVPTALMRAIAVATQPPAGPVYLSVPMDDWDHVMTTDTAIRSVSQRYAPDPERLRDFAARIASTRRLALVYGPEVDRAGGWEAGIRLAEKLGAPTFQAPWSERIPFPQSHPLFRGTLPMGRGTLAKALEGFDLVLVVGAQVFRYYPYVDGPVLVEGTEVLQITNDPHEAAIALVGDNLLSDAKLALEALYDEVPARVQPERPRGPKKTVPPAAEAQDGLLAAETVFQALVALRPEPSILLQESPSNRNQLADLWPTDKSGGFYTMPGGGLGWNAPAAVGVALAQRRLGKDVPVILFIGDGSFQYSVQSLYTAVRERLKVIFVVPVNGEYGILKAFARMEKAPDVPGMELPALNAAKMAEAYGMPAVRVTSINEIKRAFEEALARDGPSLIEFPIRRGGSVA